MARPPRTAKPLALKAVAAPVATVVEVVEVPVVAVPVAVPVGSEEAAEVMLDGIPELGT